MEKIISKSIVLLTDYDILEYITTPCVSIELHMKVSHILIKELSLNPFTSELINDIIDYLANIYCQNIKLKLELYLFKNISNIIGEYI